MFSHLVIRNLALIESLEIDLGAGLNILTGETGAGKSIVIGALQLLLGQRADRSLIRTGAESCEVSGIIELAGRGPVLKEIDRMCEEAGAPGCEDGQLVLRRVVGRKQGRCYVNSAPVTAQVLARIGDLTVDVHGPYDHQSLLDPRRQLDVLDAYLGLQEARGACRHRYRELQQARAALEQAAADAPSPERVEVLRFQLNEIREAKLTEEDDGDLAERHARTAHAQQLLEAVQAARHGLAGDRDSASDQLGDVIRHLREVASIDEPFGSELLGRAEAVIGEVREIAFELADYESDIDTDPRQLAALEERMALLRRLRRKYGASVADIRAYADQCVETLDRMENYETYRETLRAAVASAESAFLRGARELSRLRHGQAAGLGREITAKLRHLGFEKAEFGVGLSEGAPAATGIDRVEFQFAPNVGEGTKNLRDIASSGEISRVMLAIKAVLARADRVPVLIFDEIDANVGGVVALRVGREMGVLGEQHQVLCITHLPQVAAAGNRHFRVEKRVNGNRTTAAMVELDDTARVAEIGRMLGGKDASSVVLDHARELIANARQLPAG